MPESSVRHRGWCGISARLAVLLLTFLVSGCEELLETEGPRPQPARFIVFTRNVYLGADIFALQDATSLAEVPAVAGELFRDVEATAFEARAQLLANEIGSIRPSLIGLQEVALYRRQEVSDFQSNPTPNAQDTVFDFLQILLDALEQRGLDYDAVAVVENADAELPAVLDPDDPSSLSDIRLTDRDVILVPAGLQVSDVVEENFEATATLGVGGFQVPLTRGYAKIDVNVGGTTLAFVNAHVEGLAAAHEDQIQELLEFTESLDAPVILLGDLNTDADATGAPGYEILVGDGPFEDAHADASENPNPTCCYTADLTNTDVASQLDERIDLVLYRGNLEPIGVAVLGDEPTNRTTSGLWPSDHAGVAIEFVLQ